MIDDASAGSVALEANPRYVGAVVAALFMAVVLGAANLVLGDLNQDEGWYLYAALRTAEGWLPYRDYAFTQGPLLPFVYAAFAPLIREGGVGGGRVLTWGFGFLAMVLAYGTARRVGGAAAGALTLALLAVNVYQSYFFTVVKTYSLAAFFLMTGIYALVRGMEVAHRNAGAGWFLLGGAGLAAAAATRLSLGALLPLAGLWLLVDRRCGGRRGWLWFGVGGGAMLVLVFFNLWWRAPEGFYFGMVEFHTLRDGGGGLGGLVYKAGFLSRVAQAYSVAVGLLVLLLAAKMFRPFKGTDTGYHQSPAISMVRLWWAGAAVVTLVHLTAPFPYDDYQVPVYPLLAMALGVSWAYALRAWSGAGYRWQRDAIPGDPRATRWAVVSLLAVCSVAAAASPVNQEWMIAGRDRIWWRIKPEPSLVQLRSVAAEIRAQDTSGVLLTQDTYLAVEAGLLVPRGWEMGPFSFYPELDDGRAAALHLTNERRLLDTIAESPATFAAISGYGLAIASPSVSPLSDADRNRYLAALEERYALEKVVEGFGQAATTLNVYRLKEPLESGGTR